jgi:membrane protease YdiL (CAAX protease family)
LIPPDPATPGPSTPPEPLDPADPSDSPEDAASRPASPPPARPGAGTFTIEGRSAPALFVVGWLATLLGIGAIVVGALSGGGGAATLLLLVGLGLASVGLIAGAGSQAIERRARGGHAYDGPSPVLVFAASIPVSLLAVIVIAVPMAIVGIAVDGPAGRLASVAVQTVVYLALIRLLVVDARALSWSAMGLRRPDSAALREFGHGILWAGPVVVATIPVAAILGTVFPVTPASPLPPTGDVAGFAVNLLAGAILAPIGEEILFRGFATTAWAADLGPRRALVRGALFFAIAHVLTISGGSASEAIGLAVLGFATRVPVALALGWLFLQRRSIWAPIGLHAAFNGILLVLGELALRGVG